MLSYDSYTIVHRKSEGVGLQNNAKTYAPQSSSESRMEVLELQ